MPFIKTMTKYKWPKSSPLLTTEQEAIKKDWIVHWHRIVPNKFSFTENFNHKGAFLNKPLPLNCKTLEIGAGLGSQIDFENLSKQEYSVLEINPSMANICKNRYPLIKVIVGDIQDKSLFKEETFNRIIAIHVLEHLNNLPLALENIDKILKPEGFCEFVIPLEGGLIYTLARNLTSRREFEKLFGVPYEWCIKSEHLNSYVEILEELDRYFIIDWKKFFPINLPIYWINLTLGLRCYKRD